MLFEGGPADPTCVEHHAQSERPWPEHGHPGAPTPLAPAPAPVAPPASAPPPTAAPAATAYPPAPAAPAPAAPVPAAPVHPAPLQPPAAPTLAVAPAPAAVPGFPAALPDPPAPPAHRVVVRLTGGEQVEVATHADGGSARAEATALMRYLRDGGGDWPYVAGRFLRPEAIVSVDVASPPA
jgi:hypothetical protein